MGDTTRLEKDSRTRARPWRRPTAVAMVFIAWALALPWLFSDRLLNTDGDLASHLFLGRKVLEHGTTFPVDWTFTKPGGQFVAYEWLSEVILVGAERIGGLAGVVILATLVITGSIALVAAELRARIPPLLALPAAFLIASLTAGHWSARPHLASFLGVALLLTLSTRTLTVRRLPLIALIFGLWANLHPGFLYGLVIFCAFLVGDWLDRRDGATPWVHLAALVVAGLATLANPLGWGLHRSVITHLADRESFRLIHEFGPPLPWTTGGLLFYGTVAITVLLVAGSRRRPTFAAALVYVAAVAAAFSAERNVSLFALYGLPLLLLDYAPEITSRVPRRFLPTSRKMTAEDEAGATASWIGLTSVVLLVLGVTSGRIGTLRILPDTFSAEVFPSEAVSRARGAGLDGVRFFHDYTWGGYLLHAWPGQEIFIDGMANYFGSELMREYVAVMSAREGWASALARRGVDGLLVSAPSPLVSAARATGDWRVWYEDDTAVLLLKD